MPEIKYNKLVRDNIPDIIRKSGKEPVCHTADFHEYIDKLIEKLIEEVNEFKRHCSEEEIADILEVIDALIEDFDYSKERILEIKEMKKYERGAFKNKIILDGVIE